MRFLWGYRMAGGIVMATKRLKGPRDPIALAKLIGETAQKAA
jgi:hypothetical protein